MPRFSGKKADTGVPVTIDKDRYTEGDILTAMEGGIALGEKPGNVAYPIQIDASGYLKVVMSGDIVPGTEYSDGDANTSSKGTLIMGDDGANIQNISVGANGRLQIEVVAGEYDGVQYQDGAAVASPFGTVMLGHDGNNVFPVIVDGNGYLQVEITKLPNKLAAWTQILVNVSTATTTELKAAVAGHTYTVIGISLTIAAENNLTWKSNTTALSGPMDFGASGESHGWQANMWPHGLKCATGEALKLTTSTTGQVSGFVMILDES